MDQGPIIVTGVPRSGTSLVTGLVAAHGYWTGPCPSAPDTRNPKGYFENRVLQKAIHQSLEFPEAQNTILQTMKLQGYEGKKPWVVKIGLSAIACNDRWPWGNLKPRIWIYVKRNTKDIMSSMLASAKYKYKEGIIGYAALDELSRKIQDGTTEAWIEGRYTFGQDFMVEQMKQGHRVCVVHPDFLVKQNYDQFILAMKIIDEKMDVKVANEFIEPKHWHYSSGV